MNYRDDIDDLRRKASRMNGSRRRNDHDNDLDNVQAGFIMRSIVCLCFLIALIMCRLGNTEQSSQVFNTVSSGISENQSIKDMKDTIVEQIQHMLK